MQRPAEVFAMQEIQRVEFHSALKARHGIAHAADGRGQMATGFLGISVVGLELSDFP